MVAHTHRTLAWLGALSSAGMLLASLGAVPALADTDAATVSQAPGPPPAPSGAPAAASATPTTLIGVIPAPAVPPSPLPPAGSIPVPPPYTAPIGSFAMQIEVLASASPSQFGLLASPGCVTDSVYKRGMKMVFRFELYDMDNDVRVTPADGSTATVNIPNGPSLNASFIPRGGPDSQDPTAPWTWVATWQVPTNFPLGPVLYNVDVATPDGRTGELSPISIAPTYPTIYP